MRKEIFICDNCQKEHDELKNPIRKKTLFGPYLFDLCEGCYENLQKISKNQEEQYEKLSKKNKKEIKDKAPNIYTLIFGVMEDK